MPSYRGQTVIDDVLSTFCKDEGETVQERKRPSSTSQGARSYDACGNTRRTGTHTRKAFHLQEAVEVAMAAAASLRFRGCVQGNG